MTDSQIAEYGPMFIIIYLLVRDGLPLVSNLLHKVMELIIPERSKERLRLLEIEKEKINVQTDLKEREIVALEMIGKNLAIIETRLQTQDKNISTMLVGISVANNALAVILDRVHRRREDYVEHTHANAAPGPETTSNIAASD